MESPRWRSRPMARACFRVVRKLWDAASGAALRTFQGHADQIWSVAFSLDERQVRSGSRDNTLKLWDAASGALLPTFQGDSASVRSVARRLSHRAHLHMDRIEWKLAVQHVPHVGRDDTARPNNAHHFLDHRTPAPPTRTRRTRCASSRRQRQLRRQLCPAVTCQFR